MLKFITSAISNALGFSKVEARGTLMLILIMLTCVIASQLYIKRLKSTQKIAYRTELSEWVKTVEASIEIREEFDKSVYFPTKKNFEEPKKLAEKSVSEPESVEESPITIKDLNVVTAEELKTVKGIGPTYSERIIKYRNSLGGFVSNDQLKEVYGLKEETIKELLSSFSVQSPAQRININADSVKTLASHPYITFDLAWIIINYRKQNGNIETLEDLKKIKAIDDQTFSRLKPYLD